MNDANKVNSKISAQGPELGGVRFAPNFAWFLYALLVLSAGLALYAQRSPRLLPWGLASGAPWFFLGFVLLFSAYRLALVRARRYPASKAFFQIGAAALFFTLLLPKGQAPYQTADELGALLEDSNPKVRALAAEVAGFREDGVRYAPVLVRSLEDPEEPVRRQAHHSLVRLAGVDLGPPSDAGARKAWKERFP